MLYIKKDGTVIHRAQLASVIENKERREISSKIKPWDSKETHEEYRVLEIKTSDGILHSFHDEEAQKVKDSLKLDSIPERPI